MIYRMSDASEQLVDEILVMDSQTGSAKAMEMLVRRWQKRLWHHESLTWSPTNNDKSAWL